MTHLIQYPIGNTRTAYNIPSSVTSIGNGAFSQCYIINKITIPNSVTSIGNSAFCACSNMSKITIPNSVTSIGDYAFFDCYRLTNIIIPVSVTDIGQSLLSQNYALTDIFYSGNEKDKEKININWWYNPFLRDAKWHYNYTETEAKGIIENISYIGSAISADISISNSIYDSDIYLAVYDDTGRLIALYVQNANAGSDSLNITIEKDLEKGKRYTVKLMYWNNHILPNTAPDTKELIVS